MRLTIDAKQFARDGSSIEGEIPPDSLPRVQESAVSLGSAWYRVVGTRSALGKLALRVEVRCVLTLVCQRCLEPVALNIEQDVLLELCDDQREIDAADDDVDRVLSSPALDVTELVESEILLAAPMVARHEVCEAPASPEGAGQSDQLESFAAENESGPWAALARLKHR